MRFKTILLCGLLMISAAGAAVAKPPEPDTQKRDALYRKLEVLSETLNLVILNYVEETSSEELVNGAIKGIIDKLDPHSGFMPPAVYEEEQTEIKGEFEGVGLEISMQEGKAVVISPIEDGPAFNAGVQAGDVIVMIGEESIADYDMTAVVKKLRGPKGTKVTVGVLRQGRQTPMSITITRDVIRLKSVKHKKIDNIGVVRITRFQKDTHIELGDALTALEASGPIDGLVLDLRNNPGGLLDQAVKVSDRFLKGGKVVSTKGRDPEQETVFTARDDGNEPKYPVVVIINRGSASASEIVAGALKDQKRAMIVGERSFGKGSVQTMFNLSDGSGLRLTSALYYTPSNLSIQAKGITPDVEVTDGAPVAQLDKKEIKVHGIRREEDIKGHFETPQTKDKPEADKEEPAGGKSEEKGRKEAAKEVAVAKAAADQQLDRAVEILKNWKLQREIDQNLGKAEQPK